MRSRFLRNAMMVGKALNAGIAILSVTGPICYKFLTSITSRAFFMSPMPRSQVVAIFGHRDDKATSLLNCALCDALGLGSGGACVSGSDIMQPSGEGASLKDQPETASAGTRENHRQNLVFRPGKDETKGSTWELPTSSLRAGPKALTILEMRGENRLRPLLIARAMIADLAILLVDVQRGIDPVIVDHLKIITGTCIPHLLVVITRLDSREGATASPLIDMLARCCEETGLVTLDVMRVIDIQAGDTDELRKSLAAAFLGQGRPRRHRFFRMIPERVEPKGKGMLIAKGLVMESSLSKEQLVHAFPADHSVRIESIQVNGKEEASAEPGAYATLLLSHSGENHLPRIVQLAEPERLWVTEFVIGELCLFTRGTRGMRNNSRISVCLAGQECEGTVTFLDRSSRLAPGHVALVKFHCSRPVVIYRGDPLLVSNVGGKVLLGHGRVLTKGAHDWTRFSPGILHYVRALSEAGDGDLLEAELLRPTRLPMSREELARVLDITEKELEAGIKSLGHRCVLLPSDGLPRCVHRDLLERALVEVESELQRFHDKHPLLLGKTLRELENSARRIGGEAALRMALQIGLTEGRLERTGDYYHLYGRRPELSQQAAETREKVLLELEKAGGPVAMTRLLQQFGRRKLAREVLQHLQQAGEIVSVAPGMLALSSVIAEARKVMEELARKRSCITVAEFRDALGTSRKNALLILEYFDAIGLTTRAGNQRKLEPSRPGRDR